MKKGLLATQGDAVGAVNALLAGMIEKGVVDEVMAPAAQASGGCALALFSDAAKMDSVIPWAPVMPVQGGRMVSRLKFDETEATIAVVLRPCEARAVVELIKLKQVKPKNLVVISVDCPGTCEPNSFSGAGLDPKAEAARMVGELAKGEAAAPGGAELRLSCTVCENSQADWGQLRIQAYGAGESLGLEAEDSFADALEGAELASFDGSGLDGRDPVVSKVNDARFAKRDELFKEFEGEGQTLGNLKQKFSTCIRCLNCMESCPICYCKTCIFKTPTFDHASDKYAEWSMRKGVQKMPSETMLFHLTRLNHMSTSCIGCGLCDTACPMGLPVTTLFRKVAQGVQEMMEYNPGASVEDPIPLSVFREDELQAESGAKD